ncbi:hypothetical protein FGO68_gene9298 [Halteria grandinella]|uniref:Uncharacterized protein n=1 Tax=Halteria grandinella TaxID=5974 RepID=A0A8J8NR78_HALGN|nr:hypothetical protein FGO68_gene9298 [Halteria grandinella]
MGVQKGNWEGQVHGQEGKELGGVSEEAEGDEVEGTGGQQAIVRAALAASDDYPNSGKRRRQLLLPAHPFSPLHAQ